MSEASEHLHIHSDLDQGPEAQHHTLGPRSDQAAPGVHNHNFSVLALPTASSAYRGMIAVVFSPAGTADSMYTCLKSAANTYSWKLIVSG